MLGWAYGSKGKKGGGGKSEEESQEEESCRREGKEEENIGISLTALEWGARGKSHSFGGHWKAPGCRIQV